MNRSRRIIKFIFTVFLSFFFVSTLLLVTTFAIANSSYKSWKNEFERSDFDSKIMAFDASNRYEKQLLELDSMFKEFSESKNETDFVQLNDNELSILLANYIDLNLPNNFRLKDLYLNSADKSRDIYMKFTYKEYDLPWIEVNVSKDNIESAEIYITDFKIRGISASDLGMANLISEINLGYKRALTDVNENELGSRELENIELEDGVVVIKGSLN